MRNLVILATGLIVGANGALAQTLGPGDPPAGTAGSTALQLPGDYVPLTPSERLRLYLKATFGPKAIVMAGFSGGMSQWTNTPKEWGQGGIAYGDRVANSFAKHVLQETIEHGAAAALHEDNRYFRSEDTGAWKRSRHAIISVVLARNEAGGEHFAYSRVGGVLSSAFISRLWQPPSTYSAGDALINFGLTMASDVGWNFFHEFWPDLRSRLRKH